MKKKIFITAFVASAFLYNAKAQTWNLGGNAPAATSVLGNTSNQNLNIITNNTSRLTIKKTGQVGIGITNPTSTLHLQKGTLTDVLVKSTGNGAQLTLDRAGNGWDAVTRYMQTGVPQWKTGLMVNGSGSPDYVIKNEMTNSDVLTINGTSNYVNVNSGNLTLNGLSYLYNIGNDLNINAYEAPTGAAWASGNIVLANPGIGKKQSYIGLGTNDASKAKLTVQGYAGQNIAMFRRSASSAGITITADWPEIYFNSYYIGGVKAMKAGYGGLMGLDPTSGNMYFRTGSAAAASDNDPLSFNDNMVIDRFGNVGIGTFPSTYKLNVCGTIRATEIRVATGWCDYVFADDYKLPALSEVETFIKTNKHLPDVTPGSIIEGEGLEVGKTSAQMIKKIEELTLYVIDLQKQVNELKKNEK